MISKLFNNEDKLIKKEKEKEAREKEEQEREKKKIEEEIQKQKLEKYIGKAIKEEILKPGTHDTTIKIRTHGEGLFGVGKTTDKIENWVNSIIKHRGQIINISAKRDQGLIEDYIVTYWDIVVPEDWESTSEEE